jgi:alkylated DNA repair dioxygenase AlkB
MSSRKKIIHTTEPPEGLFYIPQFLTAQQEQDILAHVAPQSFEPYDHHGYKANREVVYFGPAGGYGVGGADIQPEPMPDWLIPLRERFAHLIDLSADELAMAMIARYDVGAGIGWHRDRPQFGPSVFGLSLAADAEMRFRRFVGENEEMYKINLARASAYIIAGLSRSVWQHGMIPVKQMRYSITFRTIRDKTNDSIDRRHSPVTIGKRLSELQLNSQPVSTRHEQSKQLKLSL